MNSSQDAIYNWLTIKIVCDARPDDSAAIETKELFEGMLLADHGIKNLQVTKDDTMYYVHYTINEENKQKRFPIDLVEILLNQISDNPDMYKIYPAEEK